MTSRMHCFVGGLSEKKADVYYYDASELPVALTSNTLLIPKQALLMVYIVYRFNKNNERKGL